MANTILFVDDEVVILNALKAVFSREGFQTLTATNGEEALKILDQEDVDVVVSDQRMPGISGIELLSMVKEKYPDKIRIVLTAYAELNTMISAINKVEAHRLIVKPYRNDEIVQTIRELMVRQQKIRANDMALLAAKHESDFAYRATKIMCSKGLQVEEKHDRIVNLVKDYIRAHTLSLMLYHPATKDLVVQASTNPAIIGLKRNIDEDSVSSWVARKALSIRHNATVENSPSSSLPLHDRRISNYQNFSFLSVPVMDDNKMIGVFNVADPDDGRISSNTEKTVSHLMRWVGAMVHPTVS